LRPRPSCSDLDAPPANHNNNTQRAARRITTSTIFCTVWISAFMFYPTELLQRTGPLARVWLAANRENKLSKNQILQDKISDDIAVISRPEVAGGPLSLRLSGQLLLGVVRIYSRKARYLLDDCTEALMKIKTVRVWLRHCHLNANDIRLGIQTRKH
jgi:hypothetical protein